MKTAILKYFLQALGRLSFDSRVCGAAMVAALLLSSMNLTAGTVVTTLTGGPNSKNPKYYGYTDGDTKLTAQFHTPVGLALDSSQTFLFVADRDNNALRVLDLLEDQTFTFWVGAPVSKPVGVVLDGDDNVYVLNRGTTNSVSTTGTIVEFDTFGDLIATNATGLTNAAGMAMDNIGNIYVTVNTNRLIQIAPGGAITTIATITNAGTSLQGIVVMDSGLIAACDSGRNGVLVIDPSNPSTNGSAAVAITGFNGQGDYSGINNHGATPGTGPTHAAFFSPSGVAKAGGGILVVTDTGNNRVKVINTLDVTTNLYGVHSNLWYFGTPSTLDKTVFPGWHDGTVKVPDAVGDVEARLPVGIVIAGDGTVYVTEDYYHLIRTVTGTGLPLPPPPPVAAPDPVIGTVSFPSPNFVSVLTPVSSAVFNNDVLIAIEGANGDQTFYDFGQTPLAGSIPDPDSSSSTAPPYQDGTIIGGVNPLFLNNQSPFSDLTIKAITESPGSPNSAVVSARFQFVTANPTITGDNGAQFTVSDITTNAQLWYTTDGSTPTIGGTNSFGPFTNGVAGFQLFLNASSNVTFNIRAFRFNYEPSAVVSTTFSPGNFVPNSISFGFASGEASSDFIASPGQTFYAPVTLSTLPGAVMYSLQFNLSVTNAGPNPGPAIVSGAYGFQSMLTKPIPNTTPQLYTNIPPYMYIADAVNPPSPSQIISYEGGDFVNLETTNLSLNLLSIGWVERVGETNLYDTMSQTLITFSQAHDDLFPNGAEPNGVIAGGYAFQVPTSALPGQTYQIQVARPSATSDGVGAPGSSVLIFAPTNGSLGGGAINSIKIVTAGQRKYLVGNVYPFRWFNAGDFGNTNLQNADVEQVFQSAVYGLNNPPPGSDFLDAMDSSGALGVFDAGTGYYTKAGALTVSQQNALFNGNDTTINQIAFGDGTLDVADVYVTYRRSLDPSLTWYRRFWTNGVLVADTIPNVFNPSVASKTSVPVVGKVQAAVGSNSGSVTNKPVVNFSAADFIASQGQVLQIPITAQIFGSYPLRVLMLNLTVVPLDGSPALTTPVQFTPNSALGSPTFTSSIGNGNYAAVWLNSAISGLTGNASIGTLTVTVPANASAASAYAIHFDHASASPNGIASFPRQTLTGLITLVPRTTSCYGDGIPDSWRLRYFGTTNNLLTQAAADADGDGVNNLNEYVAGTDPTDPKSYLYAGTDQAVAQNNQDCVIYWPSVNGKQYVIERSSSLFAPVWNPISTNSATGTEMEIHDTSGGGARFYRVLVQ